MFEKERSHVAQHAISQLLKPFMSTKGVLWVFQNFFFQFFIKRPELILKTQYFLSRMYSTDLRRSLFYFALCRISHVHMK